MNPDTVSGATSKECLCLTLLVMSGCRGGEFCSTGSMSSSLAYECSLALVLRLCLKMVGTYWASNCNALKSLFDTFWRSSWSFEAGG